MSALEDTIKYLKHPKAGIARTKRAFRQRALAQMADPLLDPMTRRLLPALKTLKAELTGKILDVGCYTGFLYYYLGKPSGYTGIDIADDAISVAKDLFPGADFRCADGLNFEGGYDVIWSSQITTLGPEEFKSISKLAKKSLFLLADDRMGGELLGELRLVRM